MNYFEVQTRELAKRKRTRGAISGNRVALEGH